MSDRCQAGVSVVVATYIPGKILKFCLYRYFTARADISALFLGLKVSVHSGTKLEGEK